MSKKQKKEIIVVLVITVLISALISDFLNANPKIRLIANDYLTASERQVEFNEISLSSVEIPFNELLEEENTYFDQSMMLINSDNHINEDFSADIQNYKDTDVQMNKCAVSAYENLANDVFEIFSEKLFIASAYRTDEEQSVLEKSNKYATAKGASEHEAGLALDVYVKYHAGKGFLKSESGIYVNENCWKYGFIIRYPYYGKKITGIQYEPWHLRYVGFPHSEIIYKNRLTLEEYISSLEYGKFYKYGDFTVTRQKGDIPKVPECYESVTVSSDNQNGYIYTFKN